jgi:electron transfer flavoprotein beta subunit
MNIIVCIKEVPNSLDVKIDPRTGNLDRSNIVGVINPFDKNAIEEAVRLKEKHGGNVTVISMGPPQVKESLREALALGCDDAILLSSIEFAGADTLATAYTLTKAIQKIGLPDIVLFGSYAVDADTGQTGPIVAENLAYRQITFASEINLVDDIIYATRALENSQQKVKVKLPVVVTATKNLNTPSYMTPRGILSAVRKDIEHWDYFDLECDLDQIGVNGSPTIVTEIFEPVTNNDIEMINGQPKEIAKLLVSKLVSEKIL